MPTGQAIGLHNWLRSWSQQSFHYFLDQLPRRAEAQCLIRLLAEEAILAEPSEMVQGAPPRLSQWICIQSMVSDFCPAISARMAGIATEMIPEEPATAAADSISSAVPQRKAPQPRAAGPPQQLSRPSDFLPDMRRHFLRGLSKDNRYLRFLAAFNEKVCHTDPSAQPILLMPRYSAGHLRRHTADRATGMGYMAVVLASPS